MAASTYLVELDQRRERLLSEAVDRLGVPAGSAEHEVALEFSTRSLAHHDRLDAEANKVCLLARWGTCVQWCELDCGCDTAAEGAGVSWGVGAVFTDC